MSTLFKLTPEAKEYDILEEFGKMNKCFGFLQIQREELNTFWNVEIIKVFREFQVKVAALLLQSTNKITLSLGHNNAKIVLAYFIWALSASSLHEALVGGLPRVL